MKIKSIVWGVLALVFPYLYMQGLFRLAMWDTASSYYNAGFFSLNWLCMTLYYGILALYLFLLFRAKTEKLPILIGLSIALIYLFINVLPFMAVIKEDGSSFLGYLYIATAVKSVKALLFFSYLIKIVQVLIQSPKEEKPYPAKAE